MTKCNAARWSEAKWRRHWDLAWGCYWSRPDLGQWNHGKGNHRQEWTTVLGRFGIRPKIKVQYYVLPWYLGETAMALNDLTMGLPPHSTPLEKICYANNPPYHGEQMQSLFIPEYQALVLCQPAEWCKPTNHTFLLRGWGTRRHRSLLLLQSLPSTAPGYSLCSQGQPYGVPCGMWHPSPLNYEYMWWIYLWISSSLISLVSDVMCSTVPTTVGQESLPQQRGEEEAIKAGENINHKSS